MKIWNKKTFYSGAFFSVLGTALLITNILIGFDVKNVIYMVLCFVIGFGFIERSFSKEKSKQDKLDDLDERNRLIDLKSKSKSFIITQVVSGILVALFLGVGGALDNMLILTVGIGVAVCFTISLITEFLTKIYYEKHN